MSSTSRQPAITPALTITITSPTQIAYNPANQEVASGGVVGFASANASAWEIELWNRENDDPHPLRLYVPPQGESLTSPIRLVCYPVILMLYVPPVMGSPGLRHGLG